MHTTIHTTRQSRDHKASNKQQRKKERVWQGHFVAASGEFVGTFMFLFFAFAGAQVADLTSTGNGASGPTTIQVWYICVTFGLSLLASVWVFYRISGGLFNPAVTLAMVLSGTLPQFRGLVLFPAQILGGITAAGLVSCMFPGNIRSVKTTLSSDTSVVQGLFIEMFLTCQLIITVLMLAAEKSKATFIAPVGIGLSFFVAELAGVYFTGGSLNPARSFGPCVISGSFEHYHWIYWIGPFLGSFITAGYYRFIKYYNYEEANPGQDSADGDFHEDA